MDKQKQRALDTVDAVSEVLCGLSDAIWNTPETAFTETHSAQLQCETLEELGFEVRRDLADIPTAFSGRWGSGRPVIGFLGEFDALPNLSQRAGCSIKEPVEEGGNGHGCGHNLLGTGSIGAAYALKEYLRENEKQGTVVYFGCPGEEGGSGKAFMARDGVFDELDCAISWHPMDYTAVWNISSLANYQINYHFTGISSHAAAAPHLGRSALDAVELMNVGVQFLREHIIPEARVHYAITNSGGSAPNVVQADADVLYLIRAPKTPQVQEIYERLNDIARGAALMTGTKVDVQFIKACSNIVVNDTMNAVMYDNLREVPYPAPAEEEKVLGTAILNTLLDVVPDPVNAAMALLPPKERAVCRSKVTGPYCDLVLPLLPSEKVMPGSSDVGDVSWVCPTVQMLAAAEVAGTPPHSWQTVAQGKSSYAHKMMLYAAKCMAGTGIDLLERPEAIEAAKAELAERIEHKGYQSPIPLDVRPGGGKGKH